jgi:hypothetical protein
MAIEAPPSDRSPAFLEAASTADLVVEAMDGARELARLEIALAKEEIKAELKHAERAAVGLGIALASSVLVLCLLSVALVLALGGTALVALLIALVFLVVGGVAGFVGYGKLPKSPLERTRGRLEKDVKQLKEHLT